MPHPLVLRKASFTHPAQLRANALPRRAAAAVRARAADDRHGGYVAAAAARLGRARGRSGRRPRRRGATPTRWRCRSWRTPRRSTTAGSCAASSARDGRRFAAGDADRDHACRCCSCTATATARCCPSTPRRLRRYVTGRYEYARSSPAPGTSCPRRPRTRSTPTSARWLDRLALSATARRGRGSARGAGRRCRTGGGRRGRAASRTGAASLSVSA